MSILIVEKVTVVYYVVRLNPNPSTSMYLVLP